MKLAVIAFGLTLCAAFVGFFFGIAVAASLLAFLFIFGLEHRAGSLLRNNLMRSVRNPLMPQDDKTISRTVRIVPVGMALTGIALVIFGNVNPLEGYNYFVAALGGALIAHAICARNVFSALAKEGALP